MTIIQSIDGEATIQVAPDKYAGGNVKVYDIITQRGKRTHTVKVTPEALTELFREHEIAVIPMGKLEEVKTRLKEIEESTLDNVARAGMIASIQECADEWAKPGKGETLNLAAAVLRGIIHPEPPYELPHGWGAVIVGANRDGNSIPIPFTYAGGRWITNGGTAYGEEELQARYHQFETISEGVAKLP